MFLVMKKKKLILHQHFIIERIRVMKLFNEYDNENGRFIFNFTVQNEDDMDFISDLILCLSNSLNYDFQTKTFMFAFEDITNFKVKMLANKQIPNQQLLLIEQAIKEKKKIINSVRKEFGYDERDYKE